MEALRSMRHSLAAQVRRGAFRKPTRCGFLVCFTILIAGLALGMVTAGVLASVIGAGEQQTAAWTLPEPLPVKSESVTVPAGTSIFAGLETSNLISTVRLWLASCGT